MNDTHERAMELAIRTAHNLMSDEELMKRARAIAQFLSEKPIPSSLPDALDRQPPARLGVSENIG